MATGTSGTVAAGSALAVAIILRSRNLNDTVVEAANTSKVSHWHFFTTGPNPIFLLPGDCVLS